MSAVSLAHGITTFISARNRSRRVVLLFTLHAADANVICFILISPPIALARL